MSLRQLVYRHFYAYEEMTRFLDGLRSSFPDLVEVKKIVATPEGRDVHLVTITDRAAGADDEKPAYYVQAGLHAQEGAGTTAAFHFMQTLLTDAACADLLKTLTFYVIPRVCPDGTEFALTHRTRIRSRFVVVEKRNGLIPEDLNGDGLILSMRWEDPDGPMKIDPEEPRLMVPREEDDTGPFYQVMTEGAVRNYDGGPIVDGTRLIDFNRNWPEKWKAGPNNSLHPFSEPEVHAVGDFLIAHPNIFAGVDFHCGNNAVFKPNIDPDDSLDPHDLDLIARIGKRAEAITGFPFMHQRFDYRDHRTEPRELCGVATDWAYHTLGILQYIIELGNGFNNAGITVHEYFAADERARNGEFMRRILAYHDRMGSQLFKPWEECDHPQLGRVEVGGIMHGCGYFMYPPAMENIVPHTTAFLLEHARMHPRLRISSTHIDHVDSTTHRVSASVTNDGELSTEVVRGGGAAFMRSPVQVRIAPGTGTEILSRSHVFEVDALEGRGRMDCEWLVRTGNADTITIEAAHPRAGRAQTTLHL